MRLKRVGTEARATSPKTSIAFASFEVSRPQGIDGLKLLNRIFLEIIPDEVNTVRFRRGKKRVTLRFDRNSRHPVAVNLKK